MSSPSFGELCKLLTHLSNTKGTTKKKEIFSKYINNWRANYGLDLYDGMRMFLPKLDKREYGIKEDSLAAKLVKVLGLDPTKDHGYHLKNWRLPSKVSSISGDFPSVATEKIRMRTQVTTSTKTIRETHEILDELANSNSMEKHVSILKRIITSYTPSQIYWIFCLIVKDLKIGMTENSILTAFHKDAKNAYDCGQDLYYICHELTSPSAKFNDDNISMFYPITPQRGVKSTNAEFKKFDAENQKMFLKHGRSEAPYFYVEEKIDGDRMQLHYNPDIDKFMWFTRNHNNFTERFGSSSKDIGKLSSRIYKGLPSKRIILDGEMVVLDPKTDTILPFGTLRTSTQNDTQDADEAQPYFIVFDVLWFDDKLIMPYPLEDRIYLLQSAITNQKNALKLISRKKMSTEAEVTEELNEAIKKRMEGLMVKMPFAGYQIKKTNAWLKYKPDYMDSLVENCDLLVVGAKYGTGRRQNCLAQFFCAIKDDSVPNNDNPRFVSFSMVGIGFKDEDIALINSMITSRTKYDPKNQPKWLVHPKNSSEKPDIIIDYRQNLVMETKANSMIPSGQWGMQYALRFPRFIKIREDKGWKDVMTVSEMQIVKMEGLKLKKRSLDDIHNAQKTKERKMSRSKSRTITNDQKGVDSSQIVKKTDIFETLKICIISGVKSCSKSELEKMAVENGAECVQRVENANLIISGNPGHQLRSLINSGKYNILSHQYFLDCICEKDLLNIEPKHMIHITEETSKSFTEYMDPWGDSYTALLTEKNLEETFKSMKLFYNVEEKHCRELATEYSEKYFENQLPGMLFLKVVAYFDSDKSAESSDFLTVKWVKMKKTWDDLDLMSLRFEAEGGIVSKEPSEQVTHVIINKSDLSRLEGLTQTFQYERLPRFVTSDWIEACIQNNTLIDETTFEPKASFSLS